MRIGHAKLTPVTQQFLDTCQAVVSWKMERNSEFCEHCGKFAEHLVLVTFQQYNSEQITELICQYCHDDCGHFCQFRVAPFDAIFIYDPKIEVPLVPEGVEFSDEEA